MHVNGSFKGGGDLLVNMPFHTSNLSWRGKGSRPLPAAGSCAVGRGLTQALLLILPPWPGFNHLPVPSCLCSKPTQPQLPLTHEELCDKVRKDHFAGTDACTAGPLPIPASSSAAGDGPAGRGSRWSGWRGALLSTETVAHCFEVLCRELYST